MTQRLEPARPWTHSRMQEFVDQVQAHLSAGRTRAAALMFERSSLPALREHREILEAFIEAFNGGEYEEGLWPLMDKARQVFYGPDCNCNGGEQGDALCALPHEPTCPRYQRFP